MERIILEGGFEKRAWAVTMRADADRRERNATWSFAYTSATTRSS